MLTITASNNTAKNERHIISGKNIIHQEQEITPNNFKTISTICKILTK